MVSSLNIDTTQAKIFLNLIPDYPDRLNVLNGHLIIEEVVTEILLINVKDCKSFIEARLSFSQKTKLLKAYHFEEFSAWLWEGLRLINKLRNNLSHELEPNDLDVSSSEYVYQYLSTQLRKELKVGLSENKLIVSIKVISIELLSYLEKNHKNHKLINKKI